MGTLCLFWRARRDGRSLRETPVVALRAPRIELPTAWFVASNANLYFNNQFSGL
jgi:hypothetical protein